MIPYECMVCCPVYENARLTRITPLGMKRPVFAVCPECKTEYYDNENKKVKNHYDMTELTDNSFVLNYKQIYHYRPGGMDDRELDSGSLLLSTFDEVINLKNYLESYLNDMKRGTVRTR